MKQKHIFDTFLICGLLALAPLLAGADYYVAQNGQTPLSPYTSWENAASNIQEAVVAATNNATVWVGAGRYTCPTNGVIDEGITNVVSISKPLTLRGASGNPADVIVDGLGTNRSIQVHYNSNTSDLFVMNGLTVSNSYDHGISFKATNGRTWTGVVQNCVITHGASGDGIYNKGGWNYNVSLRISDTIIRNNPGRGVVFYATGGTDSLSGVITDCVIENNGGGFSSHVANNTFRRCVIRNNDSGMAAGGGLSIGNGTNYLYNCLIHNNLSGGIGGAIYKWGAPGPMYIYNSTIVSNTSTSTLDGNPGGIRSSAITPICNSIVRFNYQNALIDDWYSFGGITFTNSNTTLHATLAAPEAGNIDTDPKFVDLAGGDFRLSKGSPCLNTGLNQNWMVDARDLDGHPRIDRSGPGVVDMGCYEFVYQGSWILIR